jgi:protein TonB
MSGIRLAGCFLLLAGVFGCAGTDRPMQLVSGSGPVYPAHAKAQGVEGTVVVRYDVASDGRVVNARVDSAEPAGIFEAAALEAVRSWRYNPAIVDGQPTAVDNVVSRVRFQLTATRAYDDY